MGQAEPRVGDRMGRYELLEVLGRGGMGTVFRARDEQLQRDVAVKVILPGLAADAEFRERFRREAVVLSQMDSPHVVSVFDHGEQDGAPYLVTQLVRGGDLLGLLRERGTLDPAYAVDLVRQVLDGLADAHVAGVVHRDVKPSNVLLRDDRRVAYLCDFGIATSPGGELTRTGVMVGSSSYMAPERHSGESSGRTGVAGDVYAAGCLLWQLLAGTPPYVGSEVEIAMGHLRGPIPQLPLPSRRATGGPEDDAVAREVAFVEGVNAVLARALAKDVALRYPSAKAMGHELAAIAPLAPAGLLLPEVTAVRQPLALAEPTEPRRRGGGPWRRVGVAAAVAVLVAGGVVLGSRLADPQVTPVVAADPQTAPATPREVDTAPVPTPSPAPSPSTAPTPAPTPTPAPAAPAAPAAEKTPAPAKPRTKKKVSAAASPTPAPVTSAPPAPRVRCWDGTSAAKLGACTLPTGRKGAEWVFPGFAKLTGCVAVDKSAPAFIEGWECRMPAGDGSFKRVSFSRWTSAAAAADRYWSGYEAGTRTRGDWLVGAATYGRRMDGKLGGLYHSSRVYSASGTNAWVFAAAANTATRRNSLLSITSFRAPAQFRGTP